MLGIKFYPGTFVRGKVLSGEVLSGVKFFPKEIMSMIIFVKGTILSEVSFVQDNFCLYEDLSVEVNVQSEFIPGKFLSRISFDLGKFCLEDVWSGGSFSAHPLNHVSVIHVSLNQCSYFHTPFNVQDNQLTGKVPQHAKLHF